MGILIGLLVLSLVVVMIGMMGYLAIARYDAYIAKRNKEKGIDEEQVRRYSKLKMDGDRGNL